jgi:CheY-like chemotaxis protein/signal transduction histidine kinase
MTSAPQSDRDIITRLERRAAREHNARLEAELIAEKQLRRSFERSREVELFASIAVIVNDADDALAALGAAAKSLRRHCDFAVSHVLVPDEDGAFVTSDIWDADPAQLDFLDLVMSATVEERFVPPRGLPGEVAASHLALWLPDLTMAANYPHQETIPRGASWAFPVVTGVEVAAVIEFVHPVPRIADERLLQLAPSIGSQLGRAFEWQRMHEHQEAERRRLEDLLAQRTDEVQSLKRSSRGADDARSSYLAYLVHEAESAMRQLRADGPTAERTAEAVASLEDIVRRLVTVADASGRRAIGDRSLVTPEQVTSSAVARHAGSPVLVTARPPEPRHDGYAAMLQVGLVDRVVDLLVDNAVRHSGAPVAEVAAIPVEDALVIEVRDHGSGFTWPHNGVRPSGGSGLEQAARIAGALGGSLTVTELSEGGTLARVRVAARAGGPASWTTRSTRVLLVDDNTINRRLAAAMLDRIGLATDVVDGGATALASMRATSYGVVFMDVQMPGIDGREATRRWRAVTDGATPANVPIVALTAHVGQAERDACREAGMDDYLSKPFGIDALAEMARKWLERDQAETGESR